MGRWSKKGCIDSAREYEDIKTWVRERKTAYLAARDNDWLKECCEHMKKRQSRWTRELCLAKAQQFSSPEEWFNSNSGSYDAAKLLNIFEECCSHMPSSKQLTEVWTLGQCKVSALKYVKMMEWRKNQRNAHNAAQANGWLSECCAHMDEFKNYIKKHDCIERALLHSRLEVFFKHEHLYYKCAKEQGWLPEIRELFMKRKMAVWLKKRFRDTDG